MKNETEYKYTILNLTSPAKSADKGYKIYKYPKSISLPDEYNSLKELILNDDTFKSLPKKYRDNIVIENNIETLEGMFYIKKKPSSELINLNFNFSVTLNEAAFQIINKIKNKSKTVNDFFEVTTGVKEYQVGKGKPKQTKEHREKSVFHADYKKDETFLPEIRGKNLSRYSIKWNNEYISYGEWLAEPRKSFFFEGKKILIRQIPNKNRLVLGYLEEKYIVDQTIYIAKLKKNINDISEKAILALLSSKLIYWYFSNMNNEFDTLFPKIKTKEFKNLPIIEMSLKEQQPIIEKVNEILSQKEENSQVDTSQLEDEIDKMVYELYELTEEEIEIVENSVK